MQVAEMENVADLGLGSNLNILLIQIYAHGSQSGIESIRRSIFRPKESFACLSFLQSQLISLLSKRLGGRS